MSGKDIAKASTISIDCTGKTLDMFLENYNEALIQSRRSSFEDVEVPDDEYSEVEEHDTRLEDYEGRNVKILLTNVKIMVLHCVLFLLSTNLNR